MSVITLVRHGQANSKARTEEDYDQLSPLGHQQSAWLGDYMKASGQHFTRLYVGALQRHGETATAMSVGLDAQMDARLNELNYFEMAEAAEREHAISKPLTESDFATHVPQIFRLWYEDRLDGAPEPFNRFEGRVLAALQDIASGSGPALVVTSGGVIAMAMRNALGLDIEATTRVLLSTKNASFHRIRWMNDRFVPVLFNAVPHLDEPGRQNAQTFV